MSINIVTWIIVSICKFLFPSFRLRSTLIVRYFLWNQIRLRQRDCKKSSKMEMGARRGSVRQSGQMEDGRRRIYCRNAFPLVLFVDNWIEIDTTHSGRAQMVFRVTCFIALEFHHSPPPPSTFSRHHHHQCVKICLWSFSLASRILPRFMSKFTSNGVYSHSRSYRWLSRRRRRIQREIDFWNKLFTLHGRDLCDDT